MLSTLTSTEYFTLWALPKPQQVPLARHRENSRAPCDSRITHHMLSDRCTALERDDPTIGSQRCGRWRTQR